MPSLKNKMIAVSAALMISTPALAQEPDADTVITTVGGAEITLGQMIVLGTQLPAQYQQLPDDVLYNAILEQLVRQTALAQTVEGKLSYEAQLALENQRRSFLANEALALAMDDIVTEEALQAAYDAQYADLEPESEFNASHILVESEEEAQAIKAELEGGADFAELAKEKSTGPSGPSGGSLGWFGAGQMVKPFEDAVLALEVGAISDPVQTQFGWHIVTLNEKREKPLPTLDEVRGELTQQVREDAVEGIIERVMAETEVQNGEVDIDPALLRNQELVLNK